MVLNSSGFVAKLSSHDYGNTYERLIFVGDGYAVVAFVHWGLGV